MRIGDILRLCRQNLLRRKSRTILTVLGVIVGCCSIVMMVSIGQGINEQNERTLASMGDLSVITVYPGGGGMTGMQSSEEAAVPIDEASVESMRSLAGVSGVAAARSLPMSDMVAGAGDRYVAQWMQVIGVDTDQLENVGYKLKDGRMPLRKGEALAGQELVYAFYDKFRPDGQNLRMNGGGMMCDASGNCTEVEREDPFFDPLHTKITVVTGANYQPPDRIQDVGVTSGGASGGTAGTGSSAIQRFEFTPVGVLDGDGGSFSYSLVVRLDDFNDILAKIGGATGSKATYEQVEVRATDMKDVPQIEAQIKAMGFHTSSYDGIRESMEEQTRGIRLALGGIGAVAFLVAAIGIANTMVMAVSERTREIGIMKALGCYVRDIRVMFLAEAAFIGLFGGLIGCLVSALGSWGINLAVLMSGMGMTGVGDGGDGGSGNIWLDALLGGEDVTRISVIPWWLFVAAIVFSTLVGVLAGFGPANKAVRIPALDAIKNNE